MTEKANPSKGRPAEAFKTAGAIAYGGQGDSGFIINDNNPTEISKQDPDIDATNFNSFSLGNDYSNSLFDVTIDGGEAFVFGSWIAKDTPTTITLQPNTDNQIVYLGWNKDSANDVIIGPQSSFDNSPGNIDKKISLYIFDTDSNGVTNVDDSRPIVQQSFPGEILSDGTNQFESSDGTVALEISPTGDVNIPSLEISGKQIDTNNDGIISNSSITALESFNESSSFSGYPLSPSTDLTNDSITVNSGDGLSGGGNTTLGNSTSLSVDTSDIAGPGLRSNTNNNLDLINDSITINSGDGLSGGGNTTLGNSTSLSINTSDLTGAGLDTDNNNNLKLSNSSITVSSGHGLSGGSTISLGGATQLNIDPSEFAGAGLIEDNDKNLNLANNSVTINAGNGLSGGSTISLGETINLSVDITDLTSEFAPDIHGNNSHTDNYTTLTLNEVQNNIHNIPGAGNGINYNSNNNEYSVNISEVTDTPSAGTALSLNNNTYNVQAGNFADATHGNGAHTDNYTTLTLNEVQNNTHNKPSAGTALGFDSSTNTYNVQAGNFADATHGDSAHSNDYLTSLPSAGTSLTLNNNTYSVQAGDFADATHGDSAHFNDYLTSPPTAGAALTLNNNTYNVDTGQFASDNHGNNAHTDNYTTLTLNEVQNNIHNKPSAGTALSLNNNTYSVQAGNFADATHGNSAHKNNYTTLTLNEVQNNTHNKPSAGTALSLNNNTYSVQAGNFADATHGNSAHKNNYTTLTLDEVQSNIHDKPSAGTALSLNNNTYSVKAGQFASDNHDNTAHSENYISSLSGGRGISPSNVEDADILSVDWADAAALSTGGSIVWERALDLDSAGQVEQLSGDVAGPNGPITNIEGDNLNVDDNNNLNATDTVGIENLSGGDGISPSNIDNTDTLSVDWEDANNLNNNGTINDFSAANDLDTSGNVTASFADSTHGNGAHSNNYVHTLSDSDTTDTSASTLQFGRQLELLPASGSEDVVSLTLDTKPSTSAAPLLTDDVSRVEPPLAGTDLTNELSLTQSNQGDKLSITETSPPIADSFDIMGIEFTKSHPATEIDNSGLVTIDSGILMDGVTYFGAAFREDVPGRQRVFEFKNDSGNTIAQIDMQGNMRIGGTLSTNEDFGNQANFTVE